MVNKVTGVRRRFALARKALAISVSFAAMVAIPAAAHAQTSDQPAPDETPSTEVQGVPETHSALERLQSEALSLVGIRYRYGGSSPQSGFDCSGFVRYVLRKADSLHVGRTAASMAAEGQTVSEGDLRMGDLVFFDTRGGRFSHVGIYLGRGRFIHAPSRGGRVRVEDLGQAYWQEHFVGARRLVL
ncbi:C40 family peptidase [Paraburkholderia adhaesiva]|uniref:C40 family peptidase n=1 Tax=Paraburkholderia adhaesiva TaxID=2883244 RepID=UPI001F30719C|nr:C40 family peptidase [Paraburkholderia adhaesiva]